MCVRVCVCNVSGETYKMLVTSMNTPILYPLTSFYCSNSYYEKTYEICWNPCIVERKKEGTGFIHLLKAAIDRKSSRFLGNELFKYWLRMLGTLLTLQFSWRKKYHVRLWLPKSIHDWTRNSGYRIFAVNG